MRLSHWAAGIPAAALTLLSCLASADVTQVPQGLVTPQAAAPAATRPRIGLVLGGGGAKGGAHIGVIKVLEEMHIPVTQVTNFLAFARREFRRIVLEKLREITTSDREFREEARSLLGVSE